MKAYNFLPLLLLSIPINIFSFTSFSGIIFLLAGSDSAIGAVLFAQLGLNLTAQYSDKLIFKVLPFTVTDIYTVATGSQNLSPLLSLLFLLVFSLVLAVIILRMFKQKNFYL